MEEVEEKTQTSDPKISTSMVLSGYREPSGLTNDIQVVCRTRYTQIDIHTDISKTCLQFGIRHLEVHYSNLKLIVWRETNISRSTYTYTKWIKTATKRSL